LKSLAFLTISFIILVNGIASGQERKIIGRILDVETQKPVKNAAVIIYGTTHGTFSNFLGYFELTIDPGKHKTLVTSHVGFKTSHIPIPNEDRFKFFLEKEYVPLDELNLALYPKDTLPRATPEKENATTLPGFATIATDAKYRGEFHDFVGNNVAPKVQHIPEGGVRVMFTVNEVGEAKNILFSDSTQSTLTSAVLNALKKMPPWVPATQLKNNVPQHFILPIVKTAVIDVPNLSIFYSYVQRNIRYPLQARRMGIEGVVYAELTADNSGKILSVRLLKEIEAGCDEEVTRVISQAPAEVIKSLIDETNASRFVMPFVFSLGNPIKNYPAPESDAYLLSEVAITAFGVNRKDASHFPADQKKEFMMSIESIVSTQDTYTTLEAALKKPNQVRRLALVKYNIKSLSTEVARLKNLEFLDLEGNLLEALPDEIGSLPRLDELYLFKNNIQSLPSTFGNLQKLKILGLADNQLTMFPREILLLEQLEVLDLNKNKLSAIPPEIRNLKNLKLIILSHNNITSIPKEFYDLKKLSKIYLTGNPLSSKDIELLKKSFKNADIFF
jgi:TonB family protein